MNKFDLMENNKTEKLCSELTITPEIIKSSENEKHTYEDIVQTILSRNAEVKQMMASQMAALGLSDNSINKILNMESAAKINKENK